ncbi:hypothetical protein AV530_019786 [Patagioenas fasciata monilis]|uniref:Uncharacterized protein n=1 Tax=Patagioenas fasciata monilis TaxID=372326 RepID=A0A1V4JZK9_PATFA|nr:hypothetical protein AV530_019786 [Patagioenas fasciata monilis]
MAWLIEEKTRAARKALAKHKMLPYESTAGAAPAPLALTTSSLRAPGTNGTRPLVDRQRLRPMRPFG